MTDRPTMWSEPNISGLKRYTSQNPKFRFFAISIAFVLMLFLSIYMMVRIPKNDTSLLRISSDPEKASLFLNDKLQGETPMTLRLQKGDYTLKLRKSGYKTKTMSVKLEKDTENIDEKLSVSSSQFMIHSTPDSAMIYIDDVFKGTTPLIVDESIFGKHKVRVSLPGYQEQEKIVDFDEEEELLFDMTLKLFNVSIDSDPTGANIFIDDEIASVTPWSGKLKGGVHSVRLALEGHKMIKTELEVTSDLTNIVLPFSSKSLSIEAFHKELPVYGSNIYICIVKNDRWQQKTPPLLLGMTQWNGSSNLVSSYLTQEQPIPEYGIVVTRNPLKGADIQKITMDKSGQILTKNLKLSLPGFSLTKVLGLQIDNIDFQTLSNEIKSRQQTIAHNRKFYLNKTNMTFKNRDELNSKPIQLDKSMQIETDDIIVSQNGQHMALIKNGSISIYNIPKASKIHTMPGTEAIFTNNSKQMLILNKENLTKVDLENLNSQATSISTTGKLLALSDKYAAVSSATNIAFIDIETNKEIDWQALIGADMPWKQHFKPISIYSKFVANQEKTLILGTTFGLDCAVSVVPEVALLNIWMPENVITTPTHNPLLR